MPPTEREKGGRWHNGAETHVYSFTVSPLLLLANAKTVSIKQLAPLKQIQHVLWLIN